MAARSNDNNTKEELLRAAEQLFATKGYTQTTILDITRKAGCNVAAVSYHFHGKDQLYLEVFHRQARRATTQTQERIGRLFARGPDGVTVQMLIEEFIAASFEPFLTIREAHRTTRLLLRELHDPHGPPEMLLHEVMLPLKETLVAALVRVCPSLDRERAGMCIDSVFAQINHMVTAQAILARLGERQQFPFDVERFTAHIVRFSVGGIQQSLLCESERAAPKP